MRSSTNYNLRLVEGTDLVNPLIQDVPNYEKIDEVMKDNEMASIGTAVELVSQTVHAITRTWKTTDVFRFTATANFTAGETFTVDGIQVTALLPSGEPLRTGSYITGSEVLASLNTETNVMTVYVSGGTATLAQDSERLGGELPSYYAKKTEVDTAQNTATSAGVLAQATQSELTAFKNTISNYTAEETIIGRWIDGRPVYRKIYAKTGVSLTSYTTLDPELTTNDIAQLISLDGVYLWNSAWHTSTDMYNNNAVFNVDPYINAAGLSIEIVGRTVNGYCVTAIYTKNSDAPNML